MKKLFLRAEFGPLWEPWEVDETPRKLFLIGSMIVLTKNARQQQNEFENVVDN
jgi:hypothetical protein